LKLVKKFHYLLEASLFDKIENQEVSTEIVFSILNNRDSPYDFKDANCFVQSPIYKLNKHPSFLADY
jgi:hypothetical protein